MYYINHSSLLVDMSSIWMSGINYEER